MLRAAALPVRTRLAHELVALSPTIVRGNASEILALATGVIRSPNRRTASPGTSASGRYRTAMSTSPRARSTTRSSADTYTSTSGCRARKVASRGMIHSDANDTVVDSVRPGDRVPARTRSAALFTIGSVILPVTASLIADDNSPTLRSDLRWALVVAVVAYVALLAAFVSAVRSATWDTRPALDEWQQVTDPAVETTSDDIMRWLGDAHVDAYANNLPEVERRLRWNARMQGLLAVEVTSLAVAVIIPPLI